MKLLNSKKGQGLIEYLIIVAMIGVATISITQLLANTTNFKMAQIINVLQGNAANHGLSTPDSVKSQHYKKKDFSNFMRGITTPRSSSGGQNE